LVLGRTLSTTRSGQGVPFIAADVVLAPKLEALHGLVASRELLHAASAATGLRWGLDLCD